MCRPECCINYGWARALNWGDSSLRHLPPLHGPGLDEAQIGAHKILGTLWSASPPPGCTKIQLSARLSSLRTTLGDFPRRLLSSRALLSHAPRLPLSLIFPPSSHVLRILDIERLTSLPMCWEFLIWSTRPLFSWSLADFPAGSFGAVAPCYVSRSRIKWRWWSICLGTTQTPVPRPTPLPSFPPSYLCPYLLPHLLIYFFLIFSFPSFNTFFPSSLDLNSFFRFSLTPSPFFSSFFTSSFKDKRLSRRFPIPHLRSPPTSVLLNFLPQPRQQINYPTHIFHFWLLLFFENLQHQKYSQEPFKFQSLTTDMPANELSN